MNNLPFLTPRAPVLLPKAASPDPGKSALAVFARSGPCLSWSALAALIVCFYSLDRLSHTIAAAPAAESHDVSPPKNAAPAAPPYEQSWDDEPLLEVATARAASVATLYSIGDPTPEEQLYLEYINRARANPAAEAELFRTTTDPDVLGQYESFKVDLNLMVAQFATLASAPPVSFNAKLTAAARAHTQDMFANQFQRHDGTDGSTISSRITDQGYQWSLLGENVFSRARSVWHGHAAFDVDWGGDLATGGMQDPPGHRRSIHNPEFTEVGIGVIKGTNGNVGPQLVTQDFGKGRTISPMVTGLAYYDVNGNGFYDLNEGLGGVTVRVGGAQFYAVTASSGGYSVPVPRDGTYVMTFSLAGQADAQKNAAISGSQNTKVDFTPPYVPPAVAGPDRPAINQNNSYQFTAVAGAKSHEWKYSRLAPATQSEGAEAGLTKVSSMVSPDYSAIDSRVKASGNASFHFAHPQQEDQLLTLNRLFKTTASSQLVFFSRLALAGPAQTARAQISLDYGSSWQDVWTKAGTGDRGESTFARQAISLAAFSGREIMIRFRYDLMSGTYYPQTDPGVGWYVDDISVTNADEVIEEVISETTGSAFPFRPAQSGTYYLAVRAKLSGEPLPWGPAKLVTAEAGGTVPPTIRITAIQRSSSGSAQIDFEANGSTGVFVIEKSSSITGPWTFEPSAAVQVSAPAGSFKATLGTAGDRQFYRIRSN